MTDWLDYFLKKRRGGPDIEKPVPVGDPMKDLRAPLPHNPSPINELRWKIYNLTDWGHDLLTRERRS